MNIDVKVIWLNDHLEQLTDEELEQYENALLSVQSAQYTIWDIYDRARARDE